MRIVTGHTENLIKTLAEDLRREYYALTDHSSPARKETLKKLLSERLSDVDTQEAGYVLEMLQKQFSPRANERDMELQRYKKQLMLLVEENRSLQSQGEPASQAVASKSLTKDAFAPLFHYFSDQEMNQSENDIERISDSLVQIVVFVQALEDSVNVIFQKFNINQQDSRLSTIVRKRLSEKVDSGPEELERYLAKLKERLFYFLELQHKVTIGGVKKILDELDPEKIEQEKDWTKFAFLPALRTKWDMYKKRFDDMSSQLSGNRFYRIYFEDNLKHFIRERENIHDTLPEK